MTHRDRTDGELISISFRFPFARERFGLDPPDTKVVKLTDRVTVIDDCAVLRTLLTRLLERTLGVECLPLESHAQALTHAEEVLDSKLIVLDINLGPNEPSGVEIYEWLRKKKYEGRVFFFTGHAKNSPQLQQASKTGAVVLEKPVRPAELVRIFRQSMGMQECVNL